MCLICNVCKEKIKDYKWGISDGIGYHHQKCYPGGAAAYFEKEQKKNTKEILKQFDKKLVTVLV